LAAKDGRAVNGGRRVKSGRPALMCDAGKIPGLLFLRKGVTGGLLIYSKRGSSGIRLE
jgi:hypothetical protein